MMADYKCSWCGVIITYRKKKNVPNPKWRSSICGNNNDRDVHLQLIEGGKRAKRSNSKTK